MANPSPPRKLFCFGLGYTALRLARLLLPDRGWTVAGTCRTPEQQAAAQQDGCDAVLFERGRPLKAAAQTLAGVTHLLSAVPPDQAGDPVLACHGGDIAALASLQWVGYLSTTAVYGDHGGGWVDEETTPAPSGARGRRRRAAEDAWFELWRRSAVPVHVFRLAGIYGPGRSALDQVRAGTAKRILKPGHMFARIHVDDLVAVLLASMMQPDPGAVYNVCDDVPAPSADVTEFACALLGVTPPPEIPFAEAALSPMAASFWADNRRVLNGRIKDRLGITLRYPDYRAGLQAIAAEEDT